MSTPRERALLAWAVQEIRELDELARSMIPGYDPLNSDDIDLLVEMEEVSEGEILPDEAGWKYRVLEVANQVDLMADNLYDMSPAEVESFLGEVHALLKKSVQ